jgi:hypothetical protein
VLLAIVVRVVLSVIIYLVPAGHGKCSKFGAQGIQVRASSGKVPPKNIYTGIREVLGSSLCSNANSGLLRDLCYLHWRPKQF